MFYKEALLRLICEAEERNLQSGVREFVALPDSEDGLSATEAVEELLKGGYIQYDNSGNIFSLGKSGLKVSLVSTHRGILLNERLVKNISKDEQIMDLLNRDFDIDEIARLVDASEALIRIVISDEQITE